MQLFKGTSVWVVGREGMAVMSFEGLQNAVKGGMNMDGIEVFTKVEEAELAERARKRRAHVEQFTSQHVLAASKMVLFDSDGDEIAEIEFCPTD